MPVGTRRAIWWHGGIKDIQGPMPTNFGGHGFICCLAICYFVPALISASVALAILRIFCWFICWRCQWGPLGTRSTQFQGEQTAFQVVATMAL